MSHLTTYRNNALENTNKEMLQKSVAEINGLELDYNIKNIKNSWISEAVDAGFLKDGSPIAVGLRFSTDENGNEICTVAGDFYGTGLNQTAITNKIAQIYTKNNFVDKCKQANWFLENENVTTDENGNMVLDFYRYA